MVSGRREDLSSGRRQLSLLRRIAVLFSAVACSSSTIGIPFAHGLCEEQRSHLDLSAATAPYANPPRIVRSRQRRRDQQRLADLGNVAMRGGGRQLLVSSTDGDVAAQERRKSSSATVEGLKNSLASCLAACCSKALLQPFDTIKTVQQQQQARRDDVASGSSSLFEAARAVVDREGGAGIWELFAGLGVSCIGSIPSYGMYYGAYAYCKRKFIPMLQDAYGSTNGKEGEGDPVLSDEALKLIAIALSAAMGNTLASFSRVPYEVVKQKLQTGQYTSTWVALTSMFRDEGGMRAFFPLGGVSIQMMRDIPYAVFTLVAYETLRDHWVSKAAVQRPWRDMVAGGAAGGFGTYLTNGLDVLKTRLQTDTSADLYGGSVWECARATFEEGGLGAFLRGSVPRLMHKIPANGLFFVWFELFRRMLQVESSGASNDARSKGESSGAAAAGKRAK